MVSDKFTMRKWWYAFLFSLVVVPLGIFLGGLTCAGALVSGAQNGAIAVFIVVFCISFYMSYRLGRAKALEMEPPEEKKPGNDVPYMVKPPVPPAVPLPLPRTIPVVMPRANRPAIKPAAPHIEPPSAQAGK